MKLKILTVEGCASSLSYIAVNIWRLSRFIEVRKLHNVFYDDRPVPQLCD